jgi:hypothetical protein
LGAIFLLNACASLHSISVTEVPLERDQPVFAKRNNLAVFGIHFDNSFADELRQDLAEQCPHGRVTGILTKYEIFWYLFIQRRQVSARGFCVDGSADTPSLTMQAPRSHRTLAQQERP